MEGLDSIKDTVRDFVLKDVLMEDSATDLGNGTPLISSGVLDSISVVKLASHLESKYSITLSSVDLGIKCFNTIDTIAEMVARKLRTG